MHFVEGIGDDGEVEEEGGVYIVEEGVGRAPLVGEEGVSPGGVYGVGLPLGVEGGGGRGVVLCGGGIVDDAGDFGHRGYAYNAFDGEVSLVDELAGEVVGGELFSRCEGELD